MEKKHIYLSAGCCGYSANATKLGMILTEGRFWSRKQQCHVIYRGPDGVMDYSRIQAVMPLDGAQVSIPLQDLPANTEWHYIRRQVSDCGLESPDSPACIVRIDAEGIMIGSLPNAPTDLRVENAAGGKLVLKWRYVTLNEEIKPLGFHIYVNSGAGFDYGSIAGTVRYSRQLDYSWMSEAFAHGQLVSFVVRAYAAAGDEKNTSAVSGTADAEGPAAVTGLTVVTEIV
jgi:hypothetical protein